MPLLEPSLVLGNILLCELLVGEHGGEEVLRLRGDQPEARHLRRGGDNHLVVGVNRSDAESRETEILGKTVHNVNSVPDFGEFVIVSVLENLHDAYEARRAKNSPGVDFVTDEMDIFGLDKGDEEIKFV